MAVSSLSICKVQAKKSSEKKERSGFDPIDRNFWSDKKLSPTDKNVAGYLNSHSKDFNPSVRLIAETIGLAVKTVIKSIKKLVKAGYMLITKGSRNKSVYHMTGKISGGWKNQSDQEERQVSVVKSTTPGVVKYATHRNSSKGKAKSINDAVGDDKLEPDPPRPEEASLENGKRSPLHKKATEISKIIHGDGQSKGRYGRENWKNWRAQNETYAGLIKKHGFQRIATVVMSFMNERQNQILAGSKNNIKAVAERLESRLQ